MPLATLAFAVGAVESSEQFRWYTTYMKSDDLRSHMTKFCRQYFERINTVCCASADLPQTVDALSALYDRFASRFVKAFTATIVVVRFEQLQAKVRQGTRLHHAAEGKKLSAADDGVAVRVLASKVKQE
jgi:arginine utilization protein RocB